MMAPEENDSLENSENSVGRLAQKLAVSVSTRMDRNAFFQILSSRLRELFHYNRFCINLYDRDREVLNLFTAADGTVVESLSNTRVASNTVAGMAISSRKPVVINDLSALNKSRSAQTMATVGLNATIALPLIIRREVIGTLHVSFKRQPDNVVEILNFLLSLSPIVASFLYVLLVGENQSEAMKRGSSNSAESEDEKHGLADKLLNTPSMAQIMETARNVAKFKIPLLITGETGTGKSMLARWVHFHGPRRDKNFIKVNCPSLAPTLFESEMFGYVRGAFTGANAKRIGRIELADNGTLFLDEIGDLSAAMQSKLLQVLEDSAFERVGESQPINVDIRIISATNINIQDAIRRGTLRADLFYRLGTVMLHLSPLRERRKDIPLFISHFIKRFSEEYKIRPPHLRDSILDILCAHTWPGNIRELRNAVTSLLLRSMEGDVTESFVRESLRNSASIAESAASVRRGLSTTAPVNSGDSKPVPLPNPRDFGSLRDMENRHILEALERCGGKVAGPGGAAALLGIPRSTLQYRLRKLGIKKSGSVR